MLSEVHSLRMLSSVKENVYTTKIFDIIVPKNIDLASADPVEYIFIVMEYVEYDLNKILKSHLLVQKFNESHIVVLLYNMLCSLNFIHSAGLLHRDIKTDNILVDDNCDVKICDFGLARPSLPEHKTVKDAPVTREDRK